MHERKILSDSFRSEDSSPPYGYVEAVAPNKFKVVHDIAAPQRVRGLCYYAGCRLFGYGHYLLEGLSRLWATEQVKPRHFVGPNKVAPFMLDLAAPLGVSRLIQTKKPLLLEDAIIAQPSFAIHRAMAPEFIDLSERIAAHYDSGSQRRRIFLSRGGGNTAERPVFRRLDNEDAVERLFESHRFLVVRPHEIPTAQQIALLRGANFVAGPVGSAMFSTVFCKPGTRRLILAPERFWTRTDTIIGHKLRARLFYCFGETLETDPENSNRILRWTIDTGELAAVLDQVLAKAASGQPTSS